MLIEILQAPSAMVLNASCNTFRSQDHAVAGFFWVVAHCCPAKCTSSIAVPRTLSCTLSAVPTTSSRENLVVSTSGGTCFQEAAFFLPAPSGPFWIWNEARSSSYRCVSKFNHTMAESNVMDQVWLCSGERDSFLLRTSCQESARVARSLDLPRRSRD